MNSQQRFVLTGQRDLPSAGQEALPLARNTIRGKAVCKSVQPFGRASACLTHVRKHHAGPKASIVAASTTAMLLLTA